MKYKYIVWIGGVDEYFKNYTDAKNVMIIGNKKNMMML